MAGPALTPDAAPLVGSGEPLTPAQAQPLAQQFDSYGGDFQGDTPGLERATRTPFGAGLRSTMITLGGSLHALAADAGAAMGLSDFAGKQMQEAAQKYGTAAIEAPPINTLSDATKGLGNMTSFVEGMAGEATGALAPMAVGAVAGPIAGVGAGLGGAAAMLPGMAGAQAWRTRRSTVAPWKKLAADVGVGAGQTALMMAAPEAAVGRGAMRAAAVPLAMGAAGAGSEALGEAGQQLVEPGAKYSPEAIGTAGVEGAMMGLPIAALAGLRGALPRGEGVKLPADRPQTAEEIRAGLGGRERPASYGEVPPDSVPDEQVPDWLDQNDERVTANHRQWQQYLADREPEGGWDKFDLSNPEHQTQFEDKLTAWHDANVDKPTLDRQVEGLADYVAKQKGPSAEKPSLQRTALDLSIMDNMVKHLSPEQQRLMAPAQRMQLAAALKDYVMHTWGRRDEQVGPSVPARGAAPAEGRSTTELASAASDAPTVRESDRPTVAKQMPHQLMDLFGDQLGPLITSTNRLLSKGGIPMEKTAGLAKGIKYAQSSRTGRLTGLENVVRQNLRDELLTAKPEDREQAVTAITDNLRDRVHNPPATQADWNDFNKQLDYAFGDNAEKVLQAFDDQREQMAKQWEPMDKDAEETPQAQEEQHGSNLAPQSIYRDERLGVPMDEDDAMKAAEGLKADYGKHVHITPEVDPDTGKVTLHADDPALKQGFTDQELENVREKHGKAGLENSVVSFVEKDPRNPERNRTVPVSIPNLVAETQRTMPWRGKGDSAAYARAVVHEGLSRLMTNPRFERFAASSEKGGWNFPDDMYVGKIGGKDWTWGEIRRSYGEGARNEERQYWRDRVDELNTQVESAKNDGSFEDNLRLQRYDTLRREAMGGDPVAKAKYNQMVRDYGRFVDEGKSGFFSDDNREGVTDIQKELVSQSNAKLESTPRDVQEETGEHLRARPLRNPEREATGESEPVTLKNGKRITFRSMPADVARPLLRRPDAEEVLSLVHPPNPGDFVIRAHGPDGKTIGYLELSRKGDSMELEPRDVRVKPEWQKQGVASAMYKEAERQGFTVKPSDYQTEAGKAFSEARVKGDAMPRPEGAQDPAQIKDDAPVWATVDEHGGVRAVFSDVGRAQAYAEEIGGAAVHDLMKNLRTALPVNKMPKFSEMNLGKGEISEADKAAIREYIGRVLGDKASVVFKALDKAGSFAKLGPEESIAISVHALDPRSVGFHEAAHALLARLSQADVRAANVLKEAAASPRVMMRLRGLLKDEPAALKQLDDPEERAAYMYQFWAAKKLDVGPRIQGLFAGVKHFLRSAAHLLLGVGEDPSVMRHADDILTAFHDGRLADRNAVAQVLDRTSAGRYNDDMGWLTHISDFADRVWSTADGYVRDMHVPAFTEIADKFHAQDGSKTGYVDAKYPIRNRYMNQLADALVERVPTGSGFAVRPLDEAGVRSVLEELQGGAKSPHVSAVKGVRKLLSDIFDYMQKAGVKAVEWDPEARTYVEHDLKPVTDYFPRVFDREAIAKDLNGFIGVLQKHGVKGAEGVVRKLMEDVRAGPGDGASDTGAADSDTASGLTYYAPETLMRRLNVPDSELAPYMVKDLPAIMGRYIGHAVRRAEYTRRFGNQGQKIGEALEQARAQGATQSQLQHFNDYVRAQEGTLGNNISPKLRSFFGGVMAYQNYRLLPLALFSSLPDALGIAVRGGGADRAFEAFTRGLRELVSNKNDADREFARSIGAIADAADEHAMSEQYGLAYTGGLAKRANDLLFKYNGMESWNNSMRIVAAAAGRDFIIRHAGDFNAHSARYLDELGLTKDDVHVDNGRLELTPQVVDAVNRWVDQAILRPTSAIRPIWMSDPHFMLIGHLKQFTYAYQKTITSRVAHEMINGNYRPVMTLGSYIPFIIASDVLRAAITPGQGDNDRFRKFTLSDWIEHGINRSGISGPGQYAADSIGDVQHGKLGIESMGGPTVEQLSDIMRAAMGEPGTSMHTEMLRALPFVPALWPGKLDREVTDD